MDNFIFSYTRAMAIADGVLIDVTPAAASYGFLLPTAITAAAYAEYVAWDESEIYQEKDSRLFKLVYESVTRILDAKLEDYGVDLTFGLNLVRNGSTVVETVNIRAMLHPGDHGEPVVTILMENED